MSVYKSTYFGEINKEDDFFETEIGSKTVVVALEADFEKGLEIEMLKQIDNYLLNLSVKIKETLGKLKLELDLNEPSFVKDYISLMKEYIEEDEIQDLLEKQSSEKNIEQQLFDLLYPPNIVFYINTLSKEALCVYDFIINEEVTDDLLVVTIGKNEEVASVTIES